MFNLRSYFKRSNNIDELLFGEKKSQKYKEIENIDLADIEAQEETDRFKNYISEIKAQQTLKKIVKKTLQKKISIPNQIKAIRDINYYDEKVIYLNFSGILNEFNSYAILDIKNKFCFAKKFVFEINGNSKPSTNYYDSLDKKLLKSFYRHLSMIPSFPPYTGSKHANAHLEFSLYDSSVFGEILTLKRWVEIYERGLHFPETQISSELYLGESSIFKNLVRTRNFIRI